MYACQAVHGVSRDCVEGIAASARMGRVSGRRGGRRAAGRASVAIPRRALGLAVLVVLCILAWGALVFLAISFGSSARSGTTSSWAFLGLAAVGAIACLFLGLLLGARMLQSLGLIESRRPHRH